MQPVITVSLQSRRFQPELSFPDDSHTHHHPVGAVARRIGGSHPSTVFPLSFALSSGWERVTRSRGRSLPQTGFFLIALWIVALILTSPQGVGLGHEEKAAMHVCSILLGSFKSLRCCSSRFETVPAAFFQSEWHSNTTRRCGWASRALLLAWCHPWGWQMVPPLQTSESALCDALTDRVQGCAEQ